MADKAIPHDEALEESYGQKIPQPSTQKGDIVAFGWSAGSSKSDAKSLTPKRNITFDDSVDDHARNQPKSH